MTDIEAICNQLIQEAEDIKNSTRTIEDLLHLPNHSNVTDTLDEIRIDKVEHIQKLTIALVSQFYDIGDEQHDK